MTPLPAELVTVLCTAAKAPEDVRTIEALVPLWLADNKLERDDEDFPWSTLCVLELHDHPEELWVFIRKALEGAETLWQVVMLAAGPLEDLIVEHGALAIDRVEHLARHSARFRFALTGVWPQDEDDNPIWERIERARATAMTTGLDAGGPLPPR